MNLSLELQMHKAMWTSARALSDKMTLDRHYARLYEDMRSHQHHPHKPASACTLLLDQPHDSWKQRYAPDPWIDQMLLARKAVSFKVRLSAALRETLQLL